MNSGATEPAAQVDVRLISPTSAAFKVFLLFVVVAIVFFFVVRAHATSTKVIGVVLAAGFLGMLWQHARFHILPPAKIRVDDQGVLLPPAPHKAAQAPTQHGDIKFAYLIGTLSTPSLVVETRSRSYEYPARFFFDRNDLRKLARAINARTRAGAAAE